jgi:hypothetical protein
VVGVRRFVAMAGVATLLSSAVFATTGSATAGPGPGYFASDNVEWVTNIAFETDTSGAKILGKYMYITTARWLGIYDISDPEAPVRLSTMPVPQEPQFSEENVDTNGKILLIGALGTLYVIDVEDKSNPQVIGELSGADNHTISCILDCTYAYGSGGIIVDLRDPTAPELVGQWNEGVPASSSHDVTEVAPGLVVTSSQPIMYLDARKDPVHPKLLALGATKDDRFIHGNEWPNRATDRFLLVGGESTGPNCAGDASSAFMTWDASRWKKTRSFTMIDEYRLENGLPTDGNALVNSFCTHWFDPHPTFKNGGTVAMAWYEHGSRFLDISSTGQIKEIGWFVPVAGATSATYWITDEIVYAVDYQRGIDILRFKN